MEYDSNLETNAPHSARIWNYWLGGTDNFAVDRAAGDQVRAAYPEVVDIARESRAFLVRVVTYLAGEAGIRQFLDIGAGLPAADNTHEIAQRVAPDARIVALMLLGVLGNVADTGAAHSIVKRLLDAVPSGSYLVINDGIKASDVHAEAEQAAHDAGHQYILRSPGKDGRDRPSNRLG